MRIDDQNNTCDLLLDGGSVVNVDDEQRGLEPGAGAVAGEPIVAVRTPDELAEKQFCRMIDCTRKAMIPGVIDAHSHPMESLARSLGESMALWPWLHDFDWPYVPTDLDATVAVAAAIERVGLRAAAVRGILGEANSSPKRAGCRRSRFATRMMRRSPSQRLPSRHTRQGVVSKSGRHCSTVVFTVVGGDVVQENRSCTLVDGTKIMREATVRSRELIDRSGLNHLLEPWRFDRMETER